MSRWCQQKNMASVPLTQKIADRLVRDTLFPFMSKQTFIYVFLMALLTSFLIWALVAAMAGQKPRLLALISRAARIVTLGIYAGMFACILFVIGNSVDRKILAYVGAVGVPFWLGLDLMRGWIRRRVKPEPKASEGGWWPTPKDS